MTSPRRLREEFKGALTLLLVVLAVTLAIAVLIDQHYAYTALGSYVGAKL